ncbi:flavin monoamine oxidase family protein [Croceicoccus gelatinilyticus]|uniref:flavin monoamine oxidase family protein n=1 Tax=Croceicoccus gelatinilyticus TaxID=2835536 RepID=UPI001BCD2756|nr:NAD(P)/FAD-dependent oxidoreductase [Croceicoccus gelatinilyticus]MBS7669073.1 FAD-dependent oxidoreductase [Croceicoccus gelatinilyticus]
MIDRVTRRALIGGMGAAALAPAFARATTAVEKVDVVVLGAGLSGLHAASLLSGNGMKTVVLEARDRVGGRILSMDAVSGNPEAGANTMLAGYGRTIGLARELDLPLYDVTQHRSAAMTYSVRGKTYDAGSWPDAPSNPFDGPRASIMPGNYVFPELGALGAMADPAGWADPANAHLDISMAAFLRQRGMTDDQIRFAYDLNPGQGRNAEETSALNWLFVSRFFAEQMAGGTEELAVVGGNSRLPEAMVQGLDADVRLSCPVRAVSKLADGTFVTEYADGKRVRSDKVVCSLPLGTMRRIAFDPLLPLDHRMAIHTVPQMMITQVHMEFSEPFWEEDGQPANMWTDTAAGIVLAARSGQDPTRISSLTAWARGDTAAALDRLSEAEAKRLVVSEIERIRPAAKGRIRVAGFKSWQNDPWSRGDWVVWAPGQASQLPLALSEARDGLHFCGEHTSVAARGMEGAMEAAERVALEILAP